jgi:hypothetical protein
VGGGLAWIPVDLGFAKFGLIFYLVLHLFKLYVSNKQGKVQNTV